HAEDREAREEREHDVVGHHRRPREVERRESEKKRSDDAPGPTPQRLPERIEKPDPERRVDEAREDHADLGHAEDAAGERGGEPPAEAISAVVTQHPVVANDRVDVAAEEDVAAQTVAAPVEHAEAARDGHEAEEKWDVEELEETRRAGVCHARTTSLEPTGRHGHARALGSGP